MSVSNSDAHTIFGAFQFHFFDNFQHEHEEFLLFYGLSKCTETMFDKCA